LQQVRLIGKGQGCRFLSTIVETWVNNFASIRSLHSKWQTTYSTIWLFWVRASCIRGMLLSFMVVK
jgi:hypothetical protein